MTYFQPFFGWILQTTLIASVVICLILLIQKMLGGKLGPRWCHALWLVLLIRMILPWAPSSRVSLSNLIPSWDRQIQREQPSEATEQQGPSGAGQTSDTAEGIPAQKSESDVTIQKRVIPGPKAIADIQIESQPWLVSLRRVLPVLWLAGSIVIGAYLLVSDLALWRIVKRDRPLVNQALLELFEECKEQMGVESLVAVVPSNQIRSPGLFGFIRPRLLLPREMLDAATAEEMRYVFLHELAHLRRHDIYLGWLTSLLQVLHWFNPLVWFAFYRMRADRELACDALVLARTQKEESQEYGQAIVSLVRRFSRSRPLPAMAGILESKSQLKRRIAMITKFKRNSYQWSPFAIILIIILACVSLPDAKRTKASETLTSQSVVPTTLRMVTDHWKRGYASVSADGKYMTELDLKTDDLVVREIATGKKQRLTSGKGYALDSLISLDGKKIAYFWDGPTGVATGLYIIGIDGSERRLLRQNEYLVPRDWSADGKCILGILFGEDQNKMVWVSTSDGTMDEIKPIGKAYPYKVDISPDERFIAYDHPQAESTSKRDIFIFDIEKNLETCLVEHSANDRLLGWTPNGQSIFFASNRTRTWDGWLLNVEDGEAKGVPRLVQANIGNVTPIGFTQSGDYYFGRYYGQPAISIYTARLNLDMGEVIAESSIMRYAVHQPRWSPDGRYLAYCSRTEEISQIIHIQDMETGRERVLDPNLPRFDWLCWCPDSQSLLATSFKETPHLLYRIDTQTGQRRVLLRSETGEICGAELSLDGKSLFYLQGPEGKSLIGKLLVKNLQTNREREILSFELNYGLPWWSLSPDGASLVIGLHEREGDVLKTISIETGQTKDLFRSQSNGRIETIAWMPDGNNILFWLGPNNRLGLNKESGLWRISADGRQAKKLWIPAFWTPNTGAMSYLGIHPDGQRIAFGAVGLISQVWVIENFLPEDLGK